MKKNIENNTNELETTIEETIDVSRETSIEETPLPKPKRTRAFALQCYDDRDDIIKFLNDSPWIQHWALCRHDKDVWTPADEKADPKHKAGEIKTAHTHVLIYTYEAKTVTAIRKIFARFSKGINPENPQNTLGQEMHDTVQAWRYLRHLDNPEKYQYPEKDVFTSGLGYWKKYEKTQGMNSASRNTGFAMFKDRDNGVSSYDMVLRYGRDYLFHAKQIDDVISRHRMEERLKNSNLNSTVEEFCKSLTEILAFSSKYNEHQRAEFSRMLETATTLLGFWEGVTYKIIKISPEGEIILS